MSCRLFKIGGACLSAREYSFQEATFLLCGMELRHGTCTFLSLCVSFPHKRHRIAEATAMAAIARGDGDDNEVSVANSACDYYAARPAALQDVTLFVFLTQFALSPTSGNDPHYEPIIVRRAQRWVRQRTKPAVLKLYPRMTQESHGDEYFYSLLLLHIPWRHDPHDLLAKPGQGDDIEASQFDSYEQAVLARGEELQQNADNQRFADELEATVQRLRALDEPGRLAAHGQVAPGGLGESQAGEAEDDDRFAAVNPALLGLHAGQEIPPDTRQAGQEGGMGLEMLDRESAGQGRMTDAQFDQARRDLSDDQRAAFEDVRQHIRTVQHAMGASVPPLYLFISGGAGVGKSFVINLLYDLIMRSHQGLTSRPVVLAAPTGVAAFNIVGVTLHSCLGLPVEKCREDGERRVTYKKLSSRQLAKLRINWHGVRYLIIDEISMVSYETFCYIDR